MHGISGKPRSRLLPFLARLFLAPSPCPLPLQLILLLLECTTFCYVISQPPITDQGTYESLLLGIGMGWAGWLALLGLAVGVRVALGGVVGRGLYVGAVVWLASVSIGQVGIVCYLLVAILLLLNIMIDILSHIQLQYSSKNPHSQTLNILKPLHYMITITALSLHILPPSLPIYVPPILSICLFVLLFITKTQSLCTSQMVKQIMLRFYLLSIGLLARNILVLGVGAARLEAVLLARYQIIIVVAVTQGLYTLVAGRCSVMQTDVEISNAHIVKVVYSALAYLYGEDSDEQMEKVLQELAQVNGVGGRTVQVHDADVKDSEEATIRENTGHANMEQGKKRVGFVDNLFKPNPKIHSLSTKCVNLLQNALDSNLDSRPHLLLLLAQTSFNLSHNIIETGVLLETLKQQTPALFLIQRLCIYKLEHRVRRYLDEVSGRVRVAHFYRDFFGNEALRDRIVRNCCMYMDLWGYLQAPDILYSGLSEKLTRILASNSQLDSLYAHTHPKCKHTTRLYCEYLYSVRRDVGATRALSREYEIYEESHYILNMDNKIYLAVGMEGKDRMVVLDCGFNVKRLLGYERGGLRFGGIENFMPRFFGDLHAGLVQDTLREDYFGLYVFSKEIMIKHYDGYYLPARLELKLVYDSEGALKMQGFILLHSDDPVTQYNWTNYFFVSQQQQLIEVGPTIAEIIDLKPRQFVHCNDYFEDQPIHDTSQESMRASSIAEGGRPQPSGNGVGQRKYLYSNGSQYQYVLYRVFRVNRDKEYLYYVCKSNEESFEEQTMTRNRLMSKFQDYLSQYLRHQKYPIKYQDFQTNLQDYFSQKQKVRQLITWRGTCLAFSLVMALFVAAFVLQGVLIARVELIRADNNVIKTDLVNLIQFYHELNNIGMILKKGSFRVKKGKLFDYQHYDLEQMCLDLQARNEYLTKFDSQTYGPSPPSTSQPQQLLSPKPLKQLISQLLSNIFSTNYLSDRQLVSLIYRNIGQIFDLIWGTALNDYSDVYIRGVNQSVNEDNRIKLAISIFVLVLLVLVYGAVLWLDAKKRGFEFEAVDLISRINAGAIFSNSIREFLRRAVGGVTDKDFGDQGKLGAGNSKMEMGSTFSARENSVRGFFEESMINSTSRQHRDLNPAPLQQNSTLPYNTIQLKQRREQDQDQRKQQKMRSASKPLILIWTVSLLSTMSIITAYLISQTATNQLSLTKSINSLLTILNRSTAFSSTVVSYLDMLSLDKPASLFLENYGNYQQLVEGNQVIAFEEVKYAEFGGFGALYQKVNYVYLCEFMECDPRYQDYVNIMYNSAVHRYNEIMRNSPTLTNITDQQLQLLFYGHYLLQKTQYTLLNTYLQNYNLFEANKYARIYIFYECQLVAFLGYFGICLVYWLWDFRGARNKYLGFMDLVKRDSYLTKDDEL